MGTPIKPKKNLPRGKKSDVTPALVDDKGVSHKIPDIDVDQMMLAIEQGHPGVKKLMESIMQRQLREAAGLTPKRGWYDIVKAIRGVKWGATCVLVFYNFFDGFGNPAVLWACIILAAFTALEWLQVGIEDYRRIK